MGGQPFIIRHGKHFRRYFTQARRLKMNDAGPFEKIIRGQAAGPARAATRWQNMRRAGSIIAQSYWGVMPQKYCPGMVNTVRQSFGVIGGDLEVLGCQLVGDAHCLVFVTGQDQGTIAFECVAGKLCPAQVG